MFDHLARALHHNAPKCDRFELFRGDQLSNQNSLSAFRKPTQCRPNANKGDETFVWLAIRFSCVQSLGRAPARQWDKQIWLPKGRFLLDRSKVCGNFRWYLNLKWREKVLQRMSYVAGNIYFFSFKRERKFSFGESNAVSRVNQKNGR